MKTKQAEVELLDTLNNKEDHTELPERLREGIYQYLSLSAQESEDMLLEAKARFAVQKRQIKFGETQGSYKDTSKKFAIGAVDFLQKGLGEKHLYYGLSRKRKKFVSSCNGNITNRENQQRPIDYLLKKAFLSV